MATSYNIQCMGAGGRPFTISGYLATDAAAGVYMNLDLNKPAVATSPDNVIVPRGAIVTDIVAAVTVTGTTPIVGVLEVIAGGQGTGIFIDVQSRGAGNAGRMPLSIPLRQGTQLMISVVTAVNDV